LTGSSAHSITPNIQGGKLAQEIWLNGYYSPSVLDKFEPMGIKEGKKELKKAGQIPKIVY
jgi:hypothetical protein